jgi:hypothetical protein
VPLKDTVWGLLAALSETESVPVVSPLLEGVKVTLIVQLASDARLPTQLSFAANWLLAAMLATFSATAP